MTTIKITTTTGKAQDVARNYECDYARIIKVTESIVLLEAEFAGFEELWNTDEDIISFEEA